MDFSWKLITRIAAMTLAITALVLALLNGFYGLALLLAVTVVAITWNIYRVVDRTNAELAAFLAV